MYKEIEYKNDIKFGLRKEYFINGQLLFEGENNLKGKKNGKGKEYDKYGRLLFEGEYKEDIEWNGKNIYIMMMDN